MRSFDFCVASRGTRVASIRRNRTLMEEDAQNRRLVLAAALCLVVLQIWGLLNAGTMETEPGLDAGVVTTSSASAPTEPALAETATVAIEVAKTRAVEPELFEFVGSVPIDDQQVPFQVSLTNVGGGIERFTLPTYFERDADNLATDEPISLADPTSQMADAEAAAFRQAAAISFGRQTSFSVPERMVFEVVEKSDHRIRYRFVTSDGIEVEREYQFRADSFEIEMAVTVRNRSGKAQDYRLEVSNALAANEAMKRGGGFFSGFVPPPDHLQTQCFTDGDVERADYREVDGEGEAYSDDVRWIAIDRQYFLAALVSRGEDTGECELMADGDVARSVMQLPRVELRPGEERRHMFTAYFGVKKPSLLTRVDAGLEGAIDYTLFGGLNLALLCTALLWVMGVLFSMTGSWGFAIIGLTLLVKVVLFPLNQRSMKSMRAISALKPEMDKIRTKHAGDQQRQNEEMMRLYREHNVNPAGGCLPMLLQMPIWIALYRALWASVDLYQQEFLWISDLTTRDPYWILPVLLVVVMFLQQKTMPSTMDAAQQKIMLYTMPLFFGFMMSALPAGLCLYILANTVLTIVQQHLINRSIGPMEGPPSVQEAKA